MEKEYKTVKVSDLIPYPTNPRINDSAVEDVAKSIEQLGYIAPIIVDEDMVILAGHTRMKALQQLGHTTADIVVVKGLTDEQKKKYRVLDNATNEESLWDFDLLKDEIEDIDLSDFNIDLFGADESYFDVIENERYTDVGKHGNMEFEITFSFPNDKKDEINDFIHNHGKEYISNMIIEEVEGNA